MTEINAFAAALREMADEADRLAKRHDMVQVAGLLRDVNDQAAKIQRDQDLIDELRRQVAAYGRSLDAIGRMRRHVLDMKAPDAVQVFAEALVLIAGERCSSFTSGTCGHAGRTRGAPYLADAWCHECIARDALERVGALLPEVNP